MLCTTPESTPGGVNTVYVISVLIVGATTVGTDAITSALPALLIAVCRELAYATELITCATPLDVAASVTNTV